MTQIYHPKPVRTDDEGTMAKETAAKRWPDILERMISGFQYSCRTAGAEAQREGKEITVRLERLATAIKLDEILEPLEPDGCDDIELYNQELEVRSPCRWQASEWLFAECFIYRYIQTQFALSSNWKGHDIFFDQKSDTFRMSGQAVEELANRFMDVLQEGIPAFDSTAGEAMFSEMLQIALWGNATDLSLLSKLSTADIQKLQGAAAIISNRDKIVSDDTSQVWQLLSRAQPKRVDIVLDNSGFEFFTDLVLAAYLLEAKLATSIHFHVKDFPWFVSDVTPSDVGAVLSGLEDTRIFIDRKGLDPLCKLFRTYFADGRFRVNQHWFWTTPVSFQEMPRVALDLMKELQGSSLIIFKGDLNYRKLLADKTWPYTTAFSTALGSIGDGSGLPILALRTNKADVCVGLRSEEQVQRLEVAASASGWVKNGKYGVISFCSGK